MEKLIVLSKFEGPNPLMPSEQRRLCEPHYKQAQKTEDLSNYQVGVNYSSCPSVWCRDCNPNLETAEAYGF